MKMRLFYLLICLCYTQVLSAQSSNWEKAVIVLQNGDSTKGKVLYRNEADIYLGFTFSDSTNLNRQLKAKEVKSLILSDYKIVYDQVSFKTKNDTFTILASLITKGTASLYQSQIDPQTFGLNKAQAPFFILESPKGIFPLLYNSDPTQIEYNKFQGIINYATGGCNDQQQINRLKYNLNAILEVVLYYNKCKDPNSIPSQINTKPHIPAIVSHQIMVGGVVASGAVGTQLDYGQTFDKPYSGGLGFTLGYSLQAIYPSISKRISTEFGIGLIYITYKADPKNRWFLKQNDDYFAGRLKILAGYALSESAVKPIIQIGPSLEFTTNVFSITPLLNLGFGINVNRYFIGGLVEFPFTSFTNRSFYSLNFKYAFAQSKNKN